MIGARAAAAIVPLALAASLAAAGPVSGSRQTVQITYSTSAPGTGAGITYAASFRNSDSPGATPPALRRLVLTAPSGALLDTSVAARCEASDAELKSGGEAACPTGSRIGTGDADVKPIIFPAIHYKTTVFNAELQQVELLDGSPPAPPTVVRGFIRGTDIDSPIPTCLNGGYAPADCATDQVSLLRNSLTIPARGRYFVTPAACPASGRWRTPVRFVYGDGVVERLTTSQPCVPARTRLKVRPRKVRRLKRRRFRFRARVFLDGSWVPLQGATIRFGGKTRVTSATGRASARLRFEHSGRRRPRLTKSGFQGARARVKVLRLPQ